MNYQLLFVLVSFEEVYRIDLPLPPEASAILSQT